jgi:PHP domain
MFQSISQTKVFNPNAGWYCGDFHVHSNLSDGLFPPANLVEIAKSVGMDFFIFTDHNTIDGLWELMTDLDILVIPGIEVTFAIGHFTVLGIRGWHDWMEDICMYPYDDDLVWRKEHAPIKDIFIHATRQGLINCLVHPLKKSWGWHVDQTDLNYVHCIEVCNCPGDSENDVGTLKAIRFWTELLNIGYRMTALGGSDYHRTVPGPMYTGTHSREAIGLPKNLCVC